MIKKSTYTKIILIVLVIIFITLIVFIRNITKQDDSSLTKMNNNTVNNVKYVENEIDEDFDIFYDEEQSAEASYSDEQLNNFEFEVKNIPDEVLEKIHDIENFNKEVKKFIYLNGLIQATEANFYDYMIGENLKDNEIAMRFFLNNVENNMLLVIMNMETGEIEISNMRYVL